MIELYMQNDVWMANYRKADSAARIFELFGTYDLPTSYTAKSTAERVLKAFQVLNDDKVVLRSHARHQAGAGSACQGEVMTDQMTEKLCDKIDAIRLRVEEVVAQRNELMAALEGLTAVLGRHELTPPAVCGCEFCQAYDVARAVLAKVKG